MGVSREIILIVCIDMRKFIQKVGSSILWTLVLLCIKDEKGDEQQSGVHSSSLCPLLWL